MTKPIHDQITVRAADSAASDGKTVFYNHSANGFDVGGGTRLYEAKDQPGATPYDRLQFALEGVSASRIIIGEADQIVDRGGNSALIIPSNTRLIGNGTLIKPSVQQSHCLETQEDADNIDIIDIDIDVNDNNTNAAFQAEGIQGLVIDRMRMRNWMYYGVDVISSDARPAKNIMLRDMWQTSPSLLAESKGINVIFPVVFRSVTGGYRVENAHIHGGVFVGTDPLNPVIGDFGDGSPNSFTADYLVFQGVNRGSMIGASVSYSGSSGSTISRGSESIVVANNHFELCQEPAINGGSGLEIAHVDDITNFYVVDSGSYDQATNGITSDGTVTGNRLAVINPDIVGVGGWLWLDGTTGGVNKLGDNLGQNGSAPAAAGTINVAAEGERDAGYSNLYGVVGFNVHHNAGVDCNLRHDPAESFAYNFIRCRGETYFHNNTAVNPRGLVVPLGLLTNSQGTVGYGTNWWEGLPANSNRYSRQGVDGVWLYEESNVVEGIGIFAKSRTSSAGNVDARSSNLACVGTGGGVYNYTLLYDPGTTGYVVLVVGQNSGVTAAVLYTDQLTFTVRMTDISGTPTDLAHSIMVMI